MRIERDTYNIFEKKGNIEIALYSVQGDRQDQQDSAGYVIEDNRVLVTVCDGMGGHAQGKAASNVSVDIICDAFSTAGTITNFDFFFRDTVEKMNAAVMGICDEQGRWAKAGSTFVGAAIVDGCLYWSSVGDSRIYLLKNSNLKQLSEDHIYKLLLDDKLENDAITKAEYDSGMENKDTLISFIGAGELRKIDVGEPIKLESGNQILLMTDGLYKLLQDESIARIIENFSNASDALSALEYKVKSEVRNKSLVRDNMTLALIKIR